MVEKISKIVNLYKQKDLLLKEELELTKPLLTDYSLIPLLYERFCEISAQKNRVYRRKEFMFVCILLYAPRLIVKNNRERVLFNAWRVIFPDISPSRLSHDKENLLIYYRLYEDFRENVNKAYYYILEKLENAKK